MCNLQISTQQHERNQSHAWIKCINAIYKWITIWSVSVSYLHIYNITVHLETVVYGVTPTDQASRSTISDQAVIVSHTNNIQVSGTLLLWEIYAKVTGTITLQIWRPTAGGNGYVLVGQVEYEVLTTGINIVKSSDYGVIDVEPGDLWGVYSSGQNVIPYVTQTCPDGQVYVVQSPVSMTVGNTYGAVVERVDPCRQYSISITITTSKSPWRTTL